MVGYMDRSWKPYGMHSTHSVICKGFKSLNTYWPANTLNYSIRRELLPADSKIGKMGQFVIMRDTLKYCTHTECVLILIGNRSNMWGKNLQIVLRQSQQRGFEYPLHRVAHSADFLQGVSPDCCRLKVFVTLFVAAKWIRIGNWTGLGVGTREHVYGTPVSVFIDV